MVRLKIYKLYAQTYASNKKLEHLENPNFATNYRVFFSLCYLLIFTIIIMHDKCNTFIQRLQRCLSPTDAIGQLKIIPPLWRPVSKRPS